MTSEQKAFARIAQLIEDARNLDHYLCKAEERLRANQMRHEAEEIARAMALGEEPPLTITPDALI